MSEKNASWENWKDNFERTYGRNTFVSRSWLRQQVQRKAQPTGNAAPAVDRAAVVATAVTSTKFETLSQIQKDLGACERCKLCKTRTNIVFGEGNPKARLMFVGEGPGANEDEQGRPFVGRAGQLLDKIIEAMGYKREEVYIGNVVKCRPPENRQPEKDEVAICEPFLFRQISTIKPEVIVALGATAFKCLQHDDEVKISEVRGQFIDYRGTKLMPTYHPAYLLRNPPAKKDVWEDMKKVKAFLDAAAGPKS